MTDTISVYSTSELLQRWRQQIAGQRCRREQRGPRAHAAISYLVRGPSHDGLVDLNQLLCVIVQDECYEGRSLATCCRTYAATAVRWGSKLGGAENCRLDKSLTIPPKLGGRGRQFDLAQPELLRLCLDLDRHLERHVQFPHMPRRYEPCLPSLWAAFTFDIAPQISFAGPEYENAGRPAVSPICTATGLFLYRLEYVSHESSRSARILADLRSVPKRQVLTLQRNKSNLTGFRGAIEFDLRNSRFSGVNRQRRQ